jgi:transcription initiation factor TFIIE subunit alpha
LCCDSFDISQYITKHFALDAAAQKAGGEPGHGLKVAGSTGERRQEDGIGIVLTTDKDEETVRRERDEEAAAKRQQNLMPAWHLKSTISGDLTALGIKETAQSAGDAQVVSPSNLDESLKGLGKVVRPPSLLVAEESDGDVEPDAKEGNEADCERALSSSLNNCNSSHTFIFSTFSPTHRLRPVLRVFGGFGRPIYALGRVLRSG